VLFVFAWPELYPIGLQTATWNRSPDCWSQARDSRDYFEEWRPAEKCGKIGSNAMTGRVGASVTGEAPPAEDAAEYVFACDN
jgi:hypothetical protein